MSIDYINRECVGCHLKCDTYIEFYDTLPVLKLDEDEIQECLTFMRNCPCALCLIKVTCRLICDPFIKYATKYQPSIYKDIVTCKKLSKI